MSCAGSNSPGEPRGSAAFPKERPCLCPLLRASSGRSGCTSFCLTGFRRSSPIFQSLPSGKHTKNYGQSQFLMGKSTISTAIFNCYVSSPEGTQILFECISCWPKPNKTSHFISFMDLWLIIVGIIIPKSK